jgi:FAD/FMN-containing dehydrogenase
MRYFGDIAKRMGGKNILALAWQFLPEAWMTLTGGMPKLVLLAEFTGSTMAEVDERLEKAKAAVAPFKVRSRVTRTEDEARKYWVMRRESFNLLRQRVKKLRTAPFIDDFCIRPSDLPKFLPELYAILGRYKLIFTVAGHVGDGNFHIIPLMDLADPKTKGTIEELSSRVYELVFKYGGSTTGEHNDGLIRGPYLRSMFGDEVYALFEEVKRIFDPDGIFNPGKKVGATIEYALRHLKRD